MHIATREVSSEQPLAEVQVPHLSGQFSLLAFDYNIMLDHDEEKTNKQ